MSPSMTPETNATLSNRTAGRLVFIALLLVAAVALVGCGGGDDDGEKAKDDIVLATVGDKEILGSYYEDRLTLLKADELPRDSKGLVMDMAAIEAKEKFLETLINKEVMAKTAVALGYNNDPQIVGARNSLLAYEAGLAMWATEVQEPANAISEEQLQAFYAQLGSSRQCRYVITNFIEDAQEARQMALSGADWLDVVDKFHDGDEDPNGVYEINVPFGRYSSNYENGVFSAEIGGVTEPIETVYGYWILMVDSEKPGKRPPLEDAKAQILDVTRGRMIAHLRTEFKEKVRDTYKFYIKEDALWKCYEGMPQTEEIFYPDTNDPVKQEDLMPLDISTVDMEMDFYGYVKSDGTERLYTLGDYKTHFDAMSVFQRPKRAQMLGGLRNKITEELEKTLVNFAAEDMGYDVDEHVIFKVDTKVEELLVNKLYNETVAYEKRITAEELDVFWAEHKADYYVPITRTGRVVICADRASADAAHAAALEGVAWREILVKYGTDKDNKSRSGKLEKVRPDGSGALQEALFALEVGEVSPPFATESQTYGVVMLESINDAYQIELEDITEDVGVRMKQLREEESFQALLVKWKGDLSIVINHENLAGMKSWRDLTIAPVPENLVPRNQ